MRSESERKRERRRNHDSYGEQEGIVIRDFGLAHVRAMRHWSVVLCCALCVALGFDRGEARGKGSAVSPRPKSWARTIGTRGEGEWRVHVRGMNCGYLPEDG